jgi:hypothetical protein
MALASVRRPRQDVGTGKAPQKTETSVHQIILVSFFPSHPKIVSSFAQIEPTEFKLIFVSLLGGRWKLR